MAQRVKPLLSVLGFRRITTLFRSIKFPYHIPKLHDRATRAPPSNLSHWRSDSDYVPGVCSSYVFLGFLIVLGSAIACGSGVLLVDGSSHHRRTRLLGGIEDDDPNTPRCHGGGGTRRRSTDAMKTESGSTDDRHRSSRLDGVAGAGYLMVPRKLRLSVHPVSDTDNTLDGTHKFGSGHWRRAQVLLGPALLTQQNSTEQSSKYGHPRCEGL